jgi:hypothetical protein
MLAANFDITLDRAADYTFAILILNANGDAVDLSTDSFYADIRQAVSKKKVLSFTTGLTATPNELILSLDESDTLSLVSSDNYEWDLFRVTTGGDTSRLLYGTLNARPNVTKGSPIEP